MRYFIALLLLLHTHAETSWDASWICGEYTPPQVKILKADYGAKDHPEKKKDLREKIQAQVDEQSYVVESHPHYAGGDPAHGFVKSLELEYTVDGVMKKHSLEEKVTFDLLMEKDPKDGVSPKANRWYAFRKTFSVDHVPEEARTRVSADSKYWLWVNGELVVFEGMVKRGPTPMDTYYDVLDLEPYLKKGENTVAVLLWYFGKEGFSHKDSGKAGLIFQADLGATSLLSGPSWKAIQHPAFGNTAPPHPNFRLPESNIHFDARKEMEGWQQPGFDDSGWQGATELGKVPCAPWNELVERPIPLWKDFGLKEYENAADLPKESNGQTIHCKLPYNAQVTPYLKVEGPAGKMIQIRTDQSAVGPNVRGEYVSKEGVQEYENLGWINGHEVQYTIPAGFKIHALMYRETGYDTEFTGTFQCDDAFFNTYHKKAVRTLYVTMRDTYFDCPDRERAQWWGDLVNEMGEAFYALDRRSDHLAKKGILELTSWQRKDGSLYSPIPDGNWNRELPMQMLNSVGYYGFWTYYLYSGDLETIKKAYPAVRTYMNLWKLGEDGLVVHRNGQWLWGDWGDDKDLKVQFNGWYYLALKGQLKMAETLGETADVQIIKERMASIQENFNKVLWTGTEYRSPGYKENTDERGHALAVLGGLAKPEQYPAIQNVFETCFESSPYMEKYVGEAQFQMGYDEEALKRIRQRYKTIVESDCSTLPELWDGKGTNNHAWSGGALTLLCQYAAGVSPLSPGFKTFQISPQMGDLKHMKLVVPSAQGDIPLELNEEGMRFRMQVTVPEGTTAELHLPKRGQTISKVSANGTLIWENGKAHKMEGIEFLKETETAVVFSAGSDPWELSVARGE